MEKKYNHIKVEENKYAFWLKNNLFKPQGKGKPFCIILPPPNVTGILHLGHAWDVSIQDTIIRYKKLCGYKTYWIPGFDHAGIATQTKYEDYLRQNNLPSRIDVGREKFIKDLMIWKDANANFIRKQWEKLGLSLDYSSQKFTMDKDVNQSVNKVFIDLYNNNLIYRGLKLVNWDIKLQTAISDIEVIYSPIKTNLYYFKYFSTEDKNSDIEVATTRPETMFGDVCIFVNPNDKRYQKFIGKTVYNPVNNSHLKIIADKYIEIDFGTGAMKCTPAHDFNDYELAQKHGLEKINIMNPDGTMNDKCGKYAGLDRLICRKKLIEELSQNGYLSKIDENYETQIGKSERTGEIIEPYLSLQWFVKMKPLASKVIQNQKKKNSEFSTMFLPKRFDKTLMTWLENIDDWCISRQLWWGHQIPVWYNKKTNEIFVGEKKSLPSKLTDWVQDKDVLDTWFSSSLWPMVCLDWNKQSKKFNEYFPTSVLVTGYDIIFFWVSRMMMLSTYFTGKKPFDKVYIHGLIRDEKGRKMSKSLGNGIEPISIIEEYGSDTLRLFLTSSSTMGDDLNFSYVKIKNCWNFLNKLWNSARYISMIKAQPIDIKKVKLNKMSPICLWILNKYNHMLGEVTKHMNNYNFVIATKYLYDFVWDDFCNTFIELSKVLINNPIHCCDVASISRYLLKNILILLHPQCPFITEEIYGILFNKKQSILKEKWSSKIIKLPKENVVETLNSIVNTIRRIRLQNNIATNIKLDINILTKNNIRQFEKNKQFFNEFLLIVNAQVVDVTNVSIVGSKITEVTSDFTVEIPFEKNCDVEIEKIKKIIKNLNFEIDRSRNILSNNNFITKAPKSKVDEEKQKLKSYEEQLKNALESLENLEEISKN